MRLILPPTITAIGPQSTNQDTPTAPIAFTVGDAETPPKALTLAGTHQIQRWFQMLTSRLAEAALSRNVIITPAAGGSGTSTITVTVSDGTLTTSTNFVLTVNPKYATNHYCYWASVDKSGYAHRSNCFYSWGCPNFTKCIDPICHLFRRNAGPGCQYRLWRKRSWP